VKARLAGLKPDGFLTALFVVVALVFLWPAPAASGGVLHMDLAATYGVAIVFFLYGLTLVPEQMRAGALHWQAHLLVQASTYVLFPIVVLAALAFAAVPTEIAIGFFFVAALPSTISSSVAMTAMARGNVALAVFNATLSSILGIFITPLLMAWYLSTTGVDLPLLPTLAKITGLVMLPIAAGQLLRRPLSRFMERHLRAIKRLDRIIVLAIVCNSAADSVMAGVWSSYDWSFLAALTAASIGLFFVMYGVVAIPCRLLRFKREDRVAILFCGSKKSLAAGVPMGQIIFGSSPALGLILAPIMIYHFWQLVIVGSIANREGGNVAPAKEIARAGA
jgi:sodium/bile acid cotransporter 7